MPTTESTGRDHRNPWPPSIGIDGRLRSESVVRFVGIRIKGAESDWLPAGSSAPPLTCPPVPSVSPTEAREPPLTVAGRLLDHVLEAGDYIQAKGAGLWLLVPMPAPLAHMLNQIGGAAEDLEDNADREPEETDDDQIDEDNGDAEPDMEGQAFTAGDGP